MLYVVTFEPMKMPTLSAPQNDRLNLVFVEDINDNIHILTGSTVANLMHHPLRYLLFIIGSIVEFSGIPKTALTTKKQKNTRFI